jgi:Icc-related predicted phosphoesterase
MSLCFFCSDLHGKEDRYGKLFAAIVREHPAAVFLGGDLLPPGLLRAARTGRRPEDFVNGFLVPRFLKVREELGAVYPEIFLILGNDDPRSQEGAILEGESRGLWRYANERKLPFAGRFVYGYAFVPPTPFGLKDWERYDVSRFVDVGCLSPEEGWRSVPVQAEQVRLATIQKDLDRLAANDDLGGAIFLFHTPPHDTKLDRAGLDGRTVDGAPMDVHIGSIAVGRFIETRQPLVTLHGHVHESARLTGAWMDRIGRTRLFSAAHDGPELALVRFDTDDPAAATRELL